MRILDVDLKNCIEYAEYEIMNDFVGCVVSELKSVRMAESGRNFAAGGANYGSATTCKGLG